jgi:hypothetical protein
VQHCTLGADLRGTRNGQWVAVCSGFHVTGFGELGARKLWVWWWDESMSRKHRVEEERFWYNVSSLMQKKLHEYMTIA